MIRSLELPNSVEAITAETYVSSYDAVFVPGARIQLVDVQDTGAVYKPSDYSQADGAGILAGNYRVDGAAGLYIGQAIPGPTLVEHENVFVFMGGVTAPINAEQVGIVPSEATVYAEAFRKRLSLLRQSDVRYAARLERLKAVDIIEEKQSMTTEEQVVKALDMAEDRQWSRILMITNEYHCLRTRAMSARELCLRGLSDKIYMSVRAAEQYIPPALYATDDGPYFEAYGSSDPHQAGIVASRIANERAGLWMIDEGSYGGADWRYIAAQIPDEQATVVERRWQRHDLKRIAEQRAAMLNHPQVLADKAFIAAFRARGFAGSPCDD